MEQHNQSLSNELSVAQDRVEELEAAQDIEQQNSAFLTLQLNKSRAECNHMKEKISMMEQEEKERKTDHETTLHKKQLQLANVQKELEKERATNKQRVEDLQRTIDMANRRHTAALKNRENITREREEQIARLKRQLADAVSEKDRTTITPVPTTKQSRDQDNPSGKSSTAQNAKRKHDQIVSNTFEHEDRATVGQQGDQNRIQAKDQELPAKAGNMIQSKLDRHNQQRPSRTMKKRQGCELGVNEDYGFLSTKVADLSEDGCDTWRLPKQVTVREVFSGACGRYTLKGTGVHDSAKYAMTGRWKDKPATYQVSRADNGKKSWFLSVRGRGETEGGTNLYCVAAGQYSRTPPTFGWQRLPNADVTKLTPPTLEY